MSADYDTYCNLAERINITFPEIDNDICMELSNNDSEYNKMRHELGELQDAFPIIILLIEGCGGTAKPVKITIEEHEALLRYISLKSEIEYIERKQIYFRGQSDCYSFLKKITGINIE